MPQLYRIGAYCIYLWSNEGCPLEPVHVHIAEGKPAAQATKVWITATGKSLLANNSSNIPEKILKKLMRFIEANSADIMLSWKKQFNEIRYFC